MYAHLVKSTTDPFFSLCGKTHSLGLIIAEDMYRRDPAGALRSMTRLSADICPECKLVFESEHADR